MVIMFIDALPSPYYNRVVGNVAFSFEWWSYANLQLVPYVPPYQPRTNAWVVSSNPIQQDVRRPPRTYDPGTWCNYHSWAVGHTTEKCWSLKYKVHDLLDGD
ncbi:hypothetical protein CR513_26536, partial [Mucuna pruriens]